jgi:hypothetical protein
MSQPAESGSIEGIVFHPPGTDVLPELEAPEVPTGPSVFEGEEGQSWHVPLYVGVTADVILRDEYLEISVVAFGERVEHLRLEEKPGGKTSGTGAFELPAVKGKMTFVADWRKKTLDADGSICGWAWTWQCTSIDKRIASW